MLCFDKLEKSVTALIPAMKNSNASSSYMNLE